MTKKGLSLQGQIACVRREIGLRNSVYPGLVNSRRMKQGAADYELGAMGDVLATLLWIERNLPAINEAIEQRALQRSGGGGRPG